MQQIIVLKLKNIYFFHTYCFPHSYLIFMELKKKPICPNPGAQKFKFLYIFFNTVLDDDY